MTNDYSSWRSYWFLVVAIRTLGSMGLNTYIGCQDSGFIRPQCMFWGLILGLAPSTYTAGQESRFLSLDIDGRARDRDSQPLVLATGAKSLDS